MNRVIFVLCAFLLFCTPGMAAMIEKLPNPAQEERAVALGDRLRCVVCQSETINESQADMARDMQALVRQKISQGWSDAQILNYLHSRYGDFVLLRPLVQKNTYFLWFAPIILLLVAGWACARLYRRM